VVDANGVPCGSVDDVELALGSRGELTVEALLLGPGASNARLPKPLASIAHRLFGSGIRRVAWARIARIDERIVLDTHRADLGLDSSERRWSRWIAKLPGA
jgi:hypothetical protein